MKLAVVEMNKATKLVLVVANGTTPGGSPKYANRTIANMNPVATNANLYAFGTALGNLQSKTVGSIRRNDVVDLMEE